MNSTNYKDLDELARIYLKMVLNIEANGTAWRRGSNLQRRSSRPTDAISGSVRCTQGVADLGPAVWASLGRVKFTFTGNFPMTVLANGVHQDRKATEPITLFGELIDCP